MKLVIFAVCMTALAFAQDKYDSLGEDVNLSEILSNDRLIAAYTKCLINKGPCTPDVKKLKDKLPEVLNTGCAKCTDKQKQLGKQFVKEVKSNHPKIWLELVNFYDPEGKYQHSFQEFLN